MKYKDYWAALALLSVSTMLKIGTFVAICTVHGQCEEKPLKLNHKSKLKGKTLKITKILK